jgi:transposase-like protein
MKIFRKFDEPENLKEWEQKLRREDQDLEKVPVDCPYCSGRGVVKRGVREKKYERVQLYLCKACDKTFTRQKTKGRKYPLRLIIDGLSYYNTGHSLEESCRLLKEGYGLDVAPQTLSNWLEEFDPLCRYSRMRDYGRRLYSPHQVIRESLLFHKQIYRFRYHRAKMDLLLQDYKNLRFKPLKEFLEHTVVDFPHQYFLEGRRSSEVKEKFDLSQVVLTEKSNLAVRMASFVLQAVNDNKERHEVLQKFMLVNDSVTVATEVPVYLNGGDLRHLQESLNYKIPLELPPEGGVLTGHIDLLQVRNGLVHILDYKPGAGKERPVQQLMVYALALSRLTGLRLYDFKCGWFDDKNYYEFFPLHVVYKLGKRAKFDKKQQLLEMENG